MPRVVVHEPTSAGLRKDNRKGSDPTMIVRQRTRVGRARGFTEY